MWIAGGVYDAPTHAITHLVTESLRVRPGLAIEEERESARAGFSIALGVPIGDHEHTVRRRVRRVYDDCADQLTPVSPALEPAGVQRRAAVNVGARSSGSES